MNLLNDISNYKQLQAMFPAGLSLNGLTLDVVLFSAGPNVLFRFVGCPISESSPQKWKEKEFKFFEFSLEFVCVSDVVIKGWKPLVKCSPKVYFDEGIYALSIQAEGVDYSCSSDFLYLKDVKPYSD